jgi:hypothetical protein
MTAMYSGLLPGVVSGIVASLVFFLALLFVRPRVQVSDKICDVGKGLYRIKIVNRTRAMLMNPQYVLEYRIASVGGNYYVDTIKPFKDPVLFVDKFDKDDKDASYAVTFSYRIPEYVFSGNPCKLVFVFIAEHAFSNTSTCIKKEYSCEDIIKGVFETGISTKIIQAEQHEYQTTTA